MEPDNATDDLTLSEPAPVESFIDVETIYDFNDLPRGVSKDFWISKV
jgi:hypothetical protein